MPCSPLYATPRRPDRATTGALTGRVAAQLGRDLMTWQQLAADVAGEIDPATGRHAYRTVVLSVPRRAGKSYLVLVTMLARALGGPGRRIWYTAQDGSNVSKLWRQEWLPIVDTSPLGNLLVKPRMSQGREEFEIPRLRSFVSAFAPVPTSLHSQAADLIVFDEAWAHAIARGRELMVAARPTMATRPDAQTWIVSAAGDVDSTWWAEILEMGRAAAAADLGRGVCHLEWSADAPGLDVDDPQVWADTHPAVITADNPDGTVELEFLADERDMDLATFLRAYLNITDRSASTSAPIPADLWAGLAVGDLDRNEPLTLGVDCSADQATTSIVACGAEVPTVELVDHRPGTAWVADRIAELLETYTVSTIVFDPGSPAGALAPAIRRAFGAPLELQLRDVTAAAAGLVEATRTATIRHIAHPAFDAAVTAARRRVVGDGAWTFDRRTSTDDVSPLIAAMFARWAHPSVNGAVPTVG